MDRLCLARELDYRTLVPVSRWCEGSALPPAQLLPDLIKVLAVNPVELSVGWMIALCPELEATLHEQVFKPLGLTFPRMI
jgi:hypothetical protein